MGGLLVATLGWRSIFLLNFPVGVLGSAMAIRFVPATPAGNSRSLDLPAQLIGALALAALTWALIERACRGCGSAAVLGALATSVALLYC